MNGKALGMKVVKRYAVGLVILLTSFRSVGAEDYHLQREIRQLEINQRMEQIQQQMSAESHSRVSDLNTYSSDAGASRTYSPISLPYYRAAHPLTQNISKEQLKQYLERLGDPDEKTGIYAYPPEERLYHYGRMCIDIGLTAEGIRAITDHTRIQAEAAIKE